jgi:molecular chaperone DnaJ
MFSISQPCSLCGGSGTVIEEPCPTCGGRGLTQQTKRYRVKVPAGVRDGSRIRLAGKGEPGIGGGPPGDLYVVTRVAPSPVFRRKGDNLEVEVPITIVEALEGGTVEVPTLSGTKRIRIPAGTRDGSVQRLRGEGPPKLSDKGRGDIHYRFRIEVPSSLTEEQRQAVDELSKVMNGDPRADLLARARQAG